MGWPEVQERMVGLETQVSLVLQAPLGPVVLMETEEREELQVAKVLQEKLVPRAYPETQAPMELV